MLLINPTGERYGGTLQSFVPLPIPTPIGCLAAYVRANGHAVRTVDEELTPIDGSSIERLVEGLPRPYVFGITCLTAQAKRTYELAGFLKSRYPDSKVILGGYHATALPEEAMADPSVDVVVAGEGERTFLSLYEAIRGGERDLSKIEGLVFRRDGEIVTTPEAPLIKDIDELPMFPYDLFDNPRYTYGLILSSRGCPYKCTYCTMRMMTGNTYRFRSTAKVVEELDILINRFGSSQITFADDNFCFKKSRVKELCAAIMAAGLHRKCEFDLQTRADNFYPDIIPLLREANFTSVGFGMETGVEHLEAMIHKGETVEQHRQAIATAHKHGMKVALFMIFGLPTETHADREETFRVCMEMNPTYLKFNNLMPYPGTPMYRDLKDTSRMVKLGCWENFVSTLADLGRPVLSHPPLPYVPDTCSEWELKRDLIRYNLRAVLRWPMIKALLLRKRGPGWLELRKRWYLQPAEVYRIAKVFSCVLLNYALASLPLGLMERLMASRPHARPKPEKPPEYVPTTWDTMTRKKALA